MDKLTAIKIKYDDGTYSDEIPVGVLSENVDWNSTLSLVDILGQVDTSESIQDQINNLKNTRATNSAISSEASTRALADSNLQSQINQIVAPSGEAPSAAEVENARIGANGKTYASLGESIRAQISDTILSQAYYYTDASKPKDLNALGLNTFQFIVGSNIQNSPVSSGGLFVFTMDNSLSSTKETVYSQIVFSLGTGNIYIRRYVQNKWDPWITCSNMRDKIASQAYYLTDASRPKDLNALGPNTFQFIVGTNVQNSPVSTYGGLFVFTMDNSLSSPKGKEIVYSQIVFSIGAGNIYIRKYVNNTWEPWVTCSDMHDKIVSRAYYFTDASHPKDLNALGLNTFQFIVGSNIKNSPVSIGGLLVFTMDNSLSSTKETVYSQIVFSIGTGNIYIRKYVNNTWEPWVTCSDMHDKIASQAYYFTDASRPKDLNALGPNTFQFIVGTNVQNSPVSSGGLFVFTMDNSLPGENTVYSQIVFSLGTGNIYIRRCINNTWDPWITCSETKKEFHVGTGQEYTSVTQAVQDAANYQNRTGVTPTVVIHEGEYDLIAEGAQGLNGGYGLFPTVNIKGIGNVRLYATLSTPSDIFSIFTIFTPSYSDITIENLTLEITNCRYCIHDEAGVEEGVTNRAYHHRYKNLKCINHGWTSGTDRKKRCIGIGLSGNGMIDIEDCAFETVYSDTSAIYAHSSWSQHQENGAVVKVHGCYIPTGGVSALSLGDATDYVNEMYVYGNLLPSNPSINDTKNMRLYAWGNTIG